MSLFRPFEVPDSRGLVRVPGLPVLPPGVERHAVPGGGSRAIPIEAGDEITVVDREGLQPCELVFFTPDGASDPAMIGAESAGSPTGLQAVLSANNESARLVRKALERSGFDLGRGVAARLFTENSLAGDSAVFTAEQDGLLLAAAPG